MVCPFARIFSLFVISAITPLAGNDPSGRDSSTF
jgi:hypothetical protein